MTEGENPRQWRYWLDFVLVPPIALALALYDCRSIAWLLGCVAGVVLWTFVEYWVHRSLLHAYLWQGAHERHHKQPAEYVTAIWWYTPILFATLYFVFPTPIYVGFALGYLGFLAVHHSLHHIDIRDATWLHRFAIWHNRHHKLAHCNYGVTSPFWDLIFRTSQ